MNCPSCSSKAILIGAWKVNRRPLYGRPNVLAQYRCTAGHHFATLRVFDEAAYQEHHTPSEQLTFVNRSSMN